MSIIKYNWNLVNKMITNKTVRGTNQSSSRSVGSRGIDKNIQIGGLTGGSIGTSAIHTQQIGNIQTSSHLNLQHSVLPLISNCIVSVTTSSGSPNADIIVHGPGGTSDPITVYRPDGSQMLCPPVLTTTQTHVFSGTGQSVYMALTYNVFYDNMGNGRFTAYWKNSQFTAQELSVIFGDNNVPIICTPASTATGLTTGTAGSITQTFSGQGFH